MPALRAMRGCMRKCLKLLGNVRGVRFLGAARQHGARRPCDGSEPTQHEALFGCPQLMPLKHCIAQADQGRQLGRATQYFSQYF